MNVYVERDSAPIKAGWASRAVALRLTAHGRDREIADLNLARTVRLFLTPFERTGTLRAEIDRLGLATDGDGGSVIVTLIDAAAELR